MSPPCTESGTWWFVFLTVSPPLYFNVVQQKGTQLVVNSQCPGSITRPDLSRVFLELDAGGKLVSLTYECATAHPHCPHPLRVGHPRLPVPFNAFPSASTTQVAPMDFDHLKGDFNGTMGTICTKSANNNVVHLATCLVAKETGDTYRYMINHAVRHPEVRPFLKKPTTTIFTDKHKGSDSAIPETLGQAEHLRCAEHMLKNHGAVGPVRWDYLLALCIPVFPAHVFFQGDLFHFGGGGTSVSRSLPDAAQGLIFTARRWWCAWFLTTTTQNCSEWIRVVCFGRGRVARFCGSVQ